jgi:hypothetical protein
MNPKNKKIVIILVIVALIIAAYYFFAKDFISGLLNKQSAIEPAINGGFNIAPAPPVVNDNFPLGIGSRGPNVKYLQQALNTINEKFPNNNKYDALVTDGEFGQKTQTALLLLIGTSVFDQNQKITQTKFTQILQRANNLKTT